MAVTQLTLPNSALPFPVRLALDHFPGYRAITVNGYNPAVPTTSEDLWGMATTQPVFSATAIIVHVASSDVDDQASGGDTGAWTLEVNGLLLNGQESTQTITLTARTEAHLDPLLWRVNSLKVLTAGTTGSNEGILYVGSGTVTTGVPAVINALIPIGYGSSVSGFYTVPAGYQGVVTGLRWEASAAGDLRLSTRAVGGAFAIQRRVLVPATVISGETTFATPIVVPALGDIKLSGLAAASTVAMAGSFDVILVPVP